MKRLFLLFCLGMTTFMHAQNVNDAVQYSVTEVGGTARFLGAGGAFSALGADFGALSQNPASLAMYRRNEIVFTPALRFIEDKSTLQNSDNYAFLSRKSKFHFPNLGLIFHTEPNSTYWKTFNVGLGFNKVANFNRNTYYEGNSKGSIMDSFLEDAQASGAVDNYYPFGAGMAYGINALYPGGAQGVTSDFDTFPNASVYKTHIQNTSGGINEMVISFGANYNDKLMMGATIGVPFMRYTKESTWTENDIKDEVPFFDNLRYTEFLETGGIGVNFKMGLIYRANQMVRIGAAIHSPTFTGMTETYHTGLQYAYTIGSVPYVGDTTSIEGTTDYKFRSPWRANLGVAVVLGKSGFLSGDVEFVDYAASQFNLTSDIQSPENEAYERALNNDINRQLKQAMNVRLGGEASLDVFRVRAGVNLMGKPYAGETGFNLAYTGGFGVRDRDGNFYVDLGYRRSTNDGTLQAYASTRNPNAAVTNAVINEFLLTVGFRMK